ncbi:TetR family transcriptional regulator [Salinisphaera sp. PC39]|uniref:TetR/AcrR family transcriptional regulator n=1 Tax=Salinisphaera sp. PC39 TaxID=1304156 RepID=UPI003340D08D
MAGKRERNKQANRAEILAAARACFIERGFDAVAVRDIVRRTSLAAGTFYNYFPDKEAVFRALLEERIGSLTVNLTRIRRGARTLRAFIYEAYLAAFEAAAEDPLFYEVILRNAPQVRELYEDSIMGISVAALEADIRDAIERGLLPEVDVEYLAAAFFGVGFEMGRCLSRRADRDPRPAAALATRLFLEGIEGAARSGDADAA